MSTTTVPTLISCISKTYDGPTLIFCMKLVDARAKDNFFFKLGFTNFGYIKVKGMTFAIFL